MFLSVNSVFTVIAVTAFVAVFVVLLPIIDRKVCAKLGLNLQHGISANKNAESLLKLRKTVLYAVFSVYVLAFLFIVLLSRGTSELYQVHVAPFEDFLAAFSSDTGVVGTVIAIIRDGFASGISHIKIISPQDIIQVFLNIMLFIPMGYLLPYTFDWFRRKMRVRPVVACFIISVATENLQLISRRGLYDLDDLLSNTLGGWIGQLLFISVAFVVTHPDWRKELRSYHRWKRHAKKKTLYPFAKKISLSRTTILATDETAIWDFYIDKLGFRIVRQLVPLDSDETQFLLEMGTSQIEIRCLNRNESLPQQYLTITATRLEKIRKRLQENGIDAGMFQQDPYTNLRCISFTGPDDIKITVIEKN